MPAKLEWLVMKIDIGTGGNRYPTPAYYVSREAEDTGATEEAAKVRNLNAAVSKTYLSPSLSNALWAVERARKTDAADAGEAAGEATSNGVLNRYLEFEVSSDEFH